MAEHRCTEPECERWTEETGTEALCSPHRGIERYQTGVADGTIVNWFPDDLIECEMDGKVQYGQIVQVEHVGPMVQIWVAVPGTSKPAMWFGENCKLLRRNRA